MFRTIQLVKDWIRKLVCGWGSQFLEQQF